MALGTTLADLRAMLKAEIGDFAGTNPVRDAELNVLLSNKQKWLATEYDWPFLERRWDASVAPGAQYTTFPTVDDLGQTTNIDMERMPRVEVLWNTQYQPVSYGIGRDEYNTMNIARGQSSDPILRWRWASPVNEPATPANSGTPNKFEVWPVPVTNQTIRFTGQRTLQTLASNSDTADLDDMLLVLFVAAERLIRSKQADGKERMELAERRLSWIKRNYPVRSRTRVLGGGEEEDFKQQRRTVGMTIVVR